LAGPRRSREPRGAPAAETPPVTDADRQRVREELELLDG
jgi:hypothetical protein